MCLFTFQISIIMKEVCILLLMLALTRIRSVVTTDNFDDVLNKLASINVENCASKSPLDLMLPVSYVSHIPNIQNIQYGVSFSNRSVLRHMHSMALNRAYFYSYIYQRLNSTADFNLQPGALYMYMSSAADVSANRGWINASSLLFDKNCAYPNWLTNLAFNRTLVYFGTRASRVNRNFETDGTTVYDYAITPGTGNEPYRYCPYAHNDSSYWWPDQTSMGKSVYTVTIKRSSESGQFETSEDKYTFHGPAVDSDRPPVEATPPYFDCGRTNRWLVSMAAPVVEYMTRYNLWMFMRRARYTAVAGVDVDFVNIDINQCPFSMGNPLPNAFAGTHKCRPTTQCQPLSGYGLKRGGYQCVCLPGYRYPAWQEGPFQGMMLEQETDALENGRYDCVKLTNDSTPDISNRFPPSPFHPNYPEETKEIRDETAHFDVQKWNKLSAMLTQVKSVTDQNCKSVETKQLFLSETAQFGASKQFEGEGRSALRLANFISNHLQNVPKIPPFEAVSSLKGDMILQESHIYGEVLAVVMSDPAILGAGVFFHKNAFKLCTSTQAYARYGHCLQFSTREYFGPYAYKTRSQVDAGDSFKIVDRAGSSAPYTKDPMFMHSEKKWNGGTNSLNTFSDEFILRIKPFNVTTSRLHHTATYRASSYKDGIWSRPQFKCDDVISDWVVTYTVPFFGRHDTAQEAVFKGVVSVDVKLHGLDINQCPSGSADAGSAFANTAKCDYQTQFCVPINGRGFTSGSYRCECRAGFEQSFNATTVEGETMEHEFRAKSTGEPNKYDSLSCKQVPQVMMPSTKAQDSTTKPTSGCSPMADKSQMAMTSVIVLILLSTS